MDHPDTAATLASLLEPAWWTAVPAMVLTYLFGGVWLESVPLGILDALAALLLYRPTLRAITKWRGKSREREIDGFMREIAGEGGGDAVSR